MDRRGFLGRALAVVGVAVLPSKPKEPEPMKMTSEKTPAYRVIGQNGTIEVFDGERAPEFSPENLRKALKATGVW